MVVLLQQRRSASPVHRTMNRLVVSCGVVLGCLLATSASAQAAKQDGEHLRAAAKPALASNYVARVGMATQLESGAPLYTERHFEHFRAGKLVDRTIRYHCPSGELFAVKTVTPNATSAAPYAPTFELNDFRTGHFERLQVSNNNKQLGFRRDFDASVDQAVLKPSPTLVADAGFDALIKERLPLLREGKYLEFGFVVPSRGRAYDFRASAEANPAGSLTVRLEPGNFLLRWLAAPISATYDRDGQLLSFRGLSNLRGLDGKNYAVAIDFPAAQQRNGSVPFDPGAAVKLKRGESCPASTQFTAL
jgi:hypothetical protein